MTYTSFNNIYDDGFQNHCQGCCRLFPTFDVTHLDSKYKLQINNEKHVRLFNNTRSIFSPYREIKSIELNKTILFLKVKKQMSYLIH